MYYYQHHIGDYRRDTAHLTLLEHGVYRQLLDLYYITEKPLDANALRLVCARDANEIEAVNQILCEFFTLEDGKYFHARCEDEIAKFHTKSDKAKASAKARWNKNKDLQNANALQTDSEGNANHKPITNNHKPRTINQEPGAKKQKAEKQVFPDWLPKTEFEAFVAFRKQSKKPLTDFATSLLVKKLEKLMQDGFNPADVLNQSILSGWTDVYPLKADYSQRQSTSGLSKAGERTRQNLAEWIAEGEVVDATRG